jgi:flagellar biosynthesis protein FliQ
MSALVELVHGGFALVLAIAVPLLVAALAGVVVAAAISRAFGIQDAALGLLARSIAVLVAVVVLGAGWAASTTQFTGDAWGSLAAIGRGGR